MNQTIKLVLFFGFTLLIAACNDHAPSEGAVNEPGAKGTFEFTPTDWQKDKKTWWKDTDGVAPGVAGCHIGTNEEGKANGRFFGEACMENGLLVESNPEAGRVHSHTNDIGHPDTFNCSTWCTGKGKTQGQCVEVSGPAPCETSARCECK